MALSRRRSFHLAGAAVCALAGIGTPLLSTAQADDYPARAVRIVVPYAAGGAADPVARLLAERLSRQTAQSFFVENRAGAGGRIGTDAVMRSAPDGYSLLVGASGLAINPALSPKGSYDLDRDLTPIALMSRVPMIIVASRKSGLTSIADLARVAKEKPGSVNYGVTGIGTMDHLVSERLRNSLALDMARIDYSGVPSALNALLSGEISLMTISINAGMAQIRAGKVVALAITSEARVPQLPEVATMAEANVPDFVMYGWTAMFTHAGTPEPIKQKLHAEVDKALADDQVRKVIVDSGGEPLRLSLADLRSYMGRDSALFQNIVQRNNIRVDQ